MQTHPQFYPVGGAPVNTSAPSLYPGGAPHRSTRRYAQGYRAPAEKYHKVANDESSVLLPAIGGTAHAILECLRSHLNSVTGQCNPSIRRIACAIGVVPSTVKENLPYLYEANVVQRVSRQRQHPRRDGEEDAVERVSNQYIFPARSEWTLDKVSRKRAKKPAAQNQPTARTG